MLMSLVAHRFGHAEFRILNISFDFFQVRLSEDNNNNKYSKFGATKSMSYQGQNNLNLLQHIIIKRVQALGMLPNITNVVLICQQLTSKSMILKGSDNLFSL